MNCNQCGGANLVEGSVMGVSGGTASYFFEPKDRSFFDKWLTIDRQNVNSYACVRCGNLQFMVDFDDEMKRKYLKFETEQTSVTETDE